MVQNICHAKDLKAQFCYCFCCTLACLADKKQVLCNRQAEPVS